jgi:hypothetical protein
MEIKDALKQIHLRAYEAEDGEVVVVAGNRRDISESPKGGVLEAEFLFNKDGKLIDAHILDERGN